MVKVTAGYKGLACAGSTTCVARKGEVSYVSVWMTVESSQRTAVLKVKVYTS